MAAEIPLRAARGGLRGPRFNEAAANGRGNLGLRCAHRFRAGGFNEAAANGRGNHRG